jgi:C4-dicarboxylate-specific signal transduction histidine kinase
VFNLLANALDAFREAPQDSPRIQIELLHSPEAPGETVVLRIQDNGPGLPEALLQQLTGPVESSKADGMGLNLLLTQSMLRLWGGQALMHNRHGAEVQGAVIALQLAISNPAS